MALSDDDLLDFDSDTYADYDEAEARRALTEHGDIYRAQLVAAKAIAVWRQRTQEYDKTELDSGFSDEYAEGWAKALAEVIAHLRQGDFLPGAGWYEETLNPR